MNDGLRGLEHGGQDGPHYDVVHHRLGQRAESQRGYGDAELADGQICVELCGRLPDEGGPEAPLLLQPVYLGRSDLYEGELRRDEQPVEGDQHERGQYPQDGQDQLFQGRSSVSGMLRARPAPQGALVLDVSLRVMLYHR
ncbi:hypothetical protein RxyAA322_19220 [Rubrobacter xylanophilus]|uniref:Uncharacterized protein n=1 Tax=Rubrobacter xylanophilus TaxID=49319 RepID=A0A510HJI2_9ACTN|nr:hypothetical protein RxyAA322_19220 [Rubrobacter xylanophilus]